MQDICLGTEGVLLFDLIHISIAFTLSLAAEVISHICAEELQCLSHTQ